MHSRYEIGVEQYVLTVAVEANLTLEIGTTTILPAALRYQTELAANVAALKAAGVEADTSTLRDGSAPARGAAGRPGRAGRGDRRHEHPEDLLEAATYCRDSVLPAMAAVRAAADTLEAPGRRRPVAAADLPGDALHPLTPVVVRRGRRRGGSPAA